MTLNEEIRFLKVMGATIVHDKVVFANLYMDARIEGKVDHPAESALEEYEHYIHRPQLYVYEQLNELGKPTGIVGWLMIGEDDVSLCVDHL